MKKYLVKLTEDERSLLVALTRKGKASTRRLKRALVLLAADEGDKDDVIAGKARVSANTVARIRQRFVEEGLEAALSERPRPGKARMLDERQEALLIAITCSTPPPGRAQWTMKLLADRLVEMEIVERISDETVRRTVKRGASSRRSADSGASRR